MALGHDLPPLARLFPLHRNSKKPAIKDWPRLATTDKETLSQWFDDTFKGHNAAVATGQGLIVLDVDTKGRDGLASLELLEMAGLPQSYRVNTPSGGVHVYLSVTEPISNSVDRLEGYPGIDVRGENGYVVAPGSTYDGRTYEAIPAPIEPAPEWIVELCRKRRHENTNDGNPHTELDTEHNIQRAQDYLERHAPQAISGEGGNDTTFKVAARLRDFGLSEPIALELLAEQWNPLNEPPWDYEDLERIASNAFRYATAAWGGASGLSDFEPVEILEEPKKKVPFELPVEWFEEAADLALSKRADMLIKGLLGENTMVVVYGPSGVRKTFAALDLAFHVAAGHAWNDLPSVQGAVVYVAAEGGFGIRRRIAALKKKHGLNVPFALIVFPLNLYDEPKHQKALDAAIAKVAEAKGMPVKLVVLDTLARVMAGGDESSAQDMGVFVRHCDAIRHKTKATVMIVHHSGKDVAKGARGSSALRAATDTELEVSGEQGSKVSCLKVTKQRDMEEIGPFRFRIEDVPLGNAADGEPISGGVVNWIFDSDFGLIELSPEDRETLEAFKLAAVGLCVTETDRWEDQIVTTQEIGEALNEMRRDRGQKPLQNRTVQARVEKLRQTGHCVSTEKPGAEGNVKAYRYFQNAVQNAVEN